MVENPALIHSINMFFIVEIRRFAGSWKYEMKNAIGGSFSTNHQ
jgi:hypothetical protein